MTRKLWAWCCALMAGGALLVAASVHAANAESQVGGVRRGGVLRVTRFSDVDSVDPALAYFSPSWALEFATCAKLFNFADEEGTAGMQVIPEVAAGLPRVSKDGKTYTIELKKSFRFHTGAPVIARSFADAFNRDADPRMQSPAVDFMREVVGVDAVSAGRAKTLSGVRVLAPYRLQIRLTKPLGDFTTRLTMPFFCPVLPTTRVDPGGVDDPPGSGPYYVAERVVNRQVVLRRNQHYRGGRPANVDQIVYTVGPRGDDCRDAVEEDRADHCLATSFSDGAYRELERKYGINRREGRFFVGPQLNSWFFAFNHDRPAFKGPGQIALKKAINYAIDRPALTRAFGYLAARRTDQLLPPALGRDVGIYPLAGADPVSARKWLAKARLKPARLVLYANASPGGAVVAQVFAFDLKQIGIDVDVRYFDTGVLLEKAGTKGEPFDVVMNGWTIDYPDGASFFVPIVSGTTLADTGNSNLSYLDDARTDARIEKANRLTGDARRRAWAQLDVDLMRTNPPLAAWAHTNRRDFISKSFGCFLRHPVYGIDLAAGCKK